MNENTLQTIIEAIVAVVILGAGIAAEGIVLTHGLPQGVDPVIAGRVLGTVDAVVMIVVNWYFGSARSDRQKTDAITAIGKAAANTPITVVMPDGTLVKQTTPAAEQAAQSATQTQQSHM
jgi:hypothetical protein